jgi:hypothetical protein
VAVPDGAAVVNVRVTTMGEPFRLATAGLNVRFMPPGIPPTALIVTGLGTFDRGVTFIVVVPVCPAVTVMGVGIGRLKSGMFRVTKSPDELAPA